MLHIKLKSKNVKKKLILQKLMQILLDVKEWSNLKIKKFKFKK